MSSLKLKDFLNTRLMLRNSVVKRLSRPVNPNEKDNLSTPPSKGGDNLSTPPSKGGDNLSTPPSKGGDNLPAWREVAGYLGRHYYPRAFTDDAVSDIELYHPLPINQSEAFLVNYGCLSDATMEKFVEACEKVGVNDLADKLRTAQ